MAEHEAWPIKIGLSKILKGHALSIASVNSSKIWSAILHGVNIRNTVQFSIGFQRERMQAFWLTKMETRSTTSRNISSSTQDMPTGQAMRMQSLMEDATRADPESTSNCSTATAATVPVAPALEEQQERNQMEFLVPPEYRRFGHLVIGFFAGCLLVLFLMNVSRPDEVCYCPPAYSDCIKYEYHYYNCTSVNNTTPL